MEESVPKNCKICGKRKPDTDFYVCGGKIRGECKKCTIKRNSIYQKKANKSVDREERKIYQRHYYAEHKKQFAEYRLRFKQRHPDYYKRYPHEKYAKKSAEKKPTQLDRPWNKS